MNEREARRGGRRASCVLAALCGLAGLLPAAAGGQTQASLGAGVGSVRYAGGSSIATAALNPALQLDAPSFSGSLNATFASLPDGAWASQGRVGLWAATSSNGGLQLAGEVTGAGTTLSDGSRSGAAHGVAELLWSARSWGVAAGAGPSAGWISGEPAVVALHTRARVFGQSGGLGWAFTVEPIRFLGAWYTDAGASIKSATERVTTQLWFTARLSETYGSKAGGGVLVQLFAAPSVAIELGGGSYLSDPYQGLPRAGYLTAGIRVYASRRAWRSEASAPSWPALVPERRGDSVVVRFRMDGARTVAIAGDWNEWRPQPLAGTDTGTWVGALELSPGTYHFTLLVDGSDWVVPAGVAVVPDRAGGMVAVLEVR